MEDIVFLNIVLFIILCNFVSKKKCIMNEIVVTLDKDADAGLLRKMIQNMKGVVKTSIRKNQRESKEDTNAENWIRKMKELSSGIDSSIVDMDDERTRYIMSK